MRREFWPARATTGHSREYWQRFTMIEWILLVPVAVAFAIASLLLLLLLGDVLVRRADVTAGLLIGSTLIDAFFARAVPSLTLPGDMRVGFTDIIATLVLCAAFARLLSSGAYILTSDG
jgi:hypothetical protein